MKTRPRKYAMAAATASLLALVGTTSLAATAAAVPRATEAGSTTYLPLSNDKATWTTGFNTIGKVLAGLDGVGWKAQPYSSTTAFQAVVRAAATTSKAPPLFTWWSGQQLVPLVQAGALAKLNSEVKVWESKYGLNPDVENAYKVNGNYYGAPLYTANWVMYYNKKDFSKYHLSVPMTWPALMHDAAVLKANGVTPFDYYVNDWAGFIWFEQFLVETNPNAYEQLVNGKISYTSPPVVAAMEQWRKVAELGYFATPSNIDTETGARFASGQAAMLLMGSWDESTLVHDGMVPGKTFGAFVVPPINPKAGWSMIFETGPVVVSAHNAAEQQAVKAVDTFMKPSVQESWDKVMSFTSAETSVQTTDPTAIAVRNEIKANKVHLLNRYWEATPPEIAVPVSTQLSKFILNPTLSLKPFLQSLQHIAASYWSSVKK